MLYFLSEIYKFRKGVNGFLDTCFSKMNKGSILVVMDFHDSNLELWIDGCASKHGLKAVIEMDDYNVTVTSGEEKSVIKEYMDKFGHPKLKAQVFFRIFRKA
jgi:hypothetical protein